MTREQMEMDAEVLMYLSTRVKTGPEANAVERALNNLLARLARMDGPPPGHVRATIKADAGPGPGEWYVPRQSESTRPYEGDQSARRSIVVVDLPLPEPAAEVEGEVK